MRTRLLAAIVVAPSVFAAAPPADVMAAALRLKQGVVQRTIEDCQKRGTPEDRCKRLLEVIHQQELKVMARLAPLATDRAVNSDRFNVELSDCYDFDYSGYVRCLEMLASRVDAARKGQFLLIR